MSNHQPNFKFHGIAAGISHRESPVQTALAIFLGICLTAPIPASAALSLDAGFAPAFRAGGGTIRAVESQPDGKWLVAGMFAFADGQSRAGMARLNPDGTLDPTFDPGTGPSGMVSVIRRQANGQILIGGTFGDYSGKAALRLARLNSDGSLDEGFQVGALFANDNISQITILADGRVAVAACNWGQAPSASLVILDENGRRETNFNPVLATGGSFPAIFTVIELPEHSLLVAGSFQQVNGEARQGLARLLPDGRVDTSFNVLLGDPASAFLAGAARQPDGKLLLAGYFSSINGQPLSRLARIGADGTVDLSFKPAHPALMGQSGISGLSLQADGKILLAGSFSAETPNPCRNLLRLNPDGSADPAFIGYVDQPSSAITRDDIRGVRALAGGQSIIWGGFPGVRGVPVTGLAVLDDTGFPKSAFTANIQEGGLVNALERLSDGRLVCGGNFSMVNQSGRENLAILNADGTTDSSFNPGAAFAQGYVARLAVQADGSILAAGSIPGQNGWLQPKFRRFFPNGSEDPAFNPALAANGSTAPLIRAILPLPDGGILVGGGFAAGTSPRNQAYNIVRLLANGALDPAFNGAPKVDDYVEALASQEDGRILIAGGFNTVSSVPRCAVARLTFNGALDTQFDASATIAQSTAGAATKINSVLVQPGGAIVVAGLFRTATSEERWSVARLNPDGSRDLAFQLSRPSQNGGAALSSAVLAPAGGDRVWVGGSASLAGGPQPGMLARLGGNGAVETACNVMVDKPGFLSVQASAILPLPDGRILVAGSFNRISGQFRNSLVRLTLDERPRLETFLRQANATTLGFATVSDPSARYRIRHAAAGAWNAPVVNWPALEETVPADGGWHTITDTTTDSSRIYALEFTR